jgi:hypothetical protein
VAISADTVVVGAQQEDSNTTGSNSTPNESASNSGAAYVFVRSGGVWSQQAYLKASNTDTGDRFAHSIAVSADTVVVGAIAEDSSATGVNGDGSNNSAEGISSGAAYVFVRTGGIWSEQAYLKASNSGANDNFGYSVAVHINTIVVGAEREDSSTTGINSTPNNNTTDAGAAYVFFRSGSTWSQQAYLKASSTTIYDVFGRSVTVSGDTVVVGSAGEDSSTTGVNSSPNESALDSGAAYVFIRSGSTWTQQAYLKASNTGQGDQLGHSVSISGNTLVVGAIGENSSTTGVNSTPNETAPYFGAAYVFVRSGSTWSQQAYLKASNAFRDDRFGWSVAVSGDTVVVGANWENSGASGVNGTPDLQSNQSGAAYAFTRTGSAWSQQAYLKSGNSSGNSFDRFGESVAVSGDTVVVGASSEDSSTTGVNSTPDESAENSGAAYVFFRSGGLWTQQAYLKASNTGTGDNFGRSVAISGDTIAIGSFLEDSGTTGSNSIPNDAATSSGAVYVFLRVGGVWSQQAYLKASNTGIGDRFGHSVGLSNNTLVVGAVEEDSGTTGVNSTPNDSASDSGAAYVFLRAGSVWSQQAYLKASNTGASDNFGISVAVSGETVVVGASQEDSSTTGVNSTSNNTASNAGAAYVFVRSGSIWSQQAYLKASNTGANDNFGQSVAVGGDTVVIGAWQEDSSTTGVNSAPNESASDSGAAYVFVRTGSVWTQQAYFKASNTGANDRFGLAVAVSGDTLVVGADREDSSTTGVNSAPNDAASDSGAAYVFVRSGGLWNQQAYLKASNSESGDSFGYSVAVSEDTVVVGATGEDSSTTGINSTPNENASLTGAAYIFTGLGPVVESPEIALEQSGSDVPTGSTHPFGSVATGGFLERTFAIFNTGTASLTLSGSPRIAISGSGDFTITSQPASADIAPGGNDTFTVRFTPTGSGPKSATLSIANNDGDENPFVIELTGTATTASALFTDTITSGTSLTGNDTLPGATPFNDGVENLLKYAFNMNLAGPNSSTMAAGGTTGLPTITVPENAPPGTIRVEFLRRKGSGLVYAPQKSTSLDNPSWSPLSGTPVVTSIDDQWERVVYTEAPDPVPATSCFGRVSVSLP